ncbi:MAG: hypothetical protein OEY14_01715 [Myxococcales bacterium]|nr:hypothetical protein [Myxococcales bacterium]
MQFPPLTPAVKKALIGIWVLYLAEVILDNWVGLGIVPLLALRTGDLHIGLLWQVVTYVVAWPTGPDALTSILISSVFFWLCLSPFEQLFGTIRTWQLMLVCTVAAALPAVAVSLFFRGSVLFGIHSIVLGGLCASVWPYRGRGKLRFFGVLPLSAEQLVLVALGFSLLSFLLSKDLSRLVADLGAVGGALLFVDTLRKSRGRPGSRQGGGSGRHLRSIKGGRGGTKPTWLN